MEKAISRISKEQSAEHALYMKDVATPMMMKITTGKEKGNPILATRKH